VKKKESKEEDEEGEEKKTRISLPAQHDRE
jgi:hypothetical protein